MNDKKPHVHDWVLRRTVIRNGHTYRFWKCKNPGCPSPDRMTIDGKPELPE